MFKHIVIMPKVHLVGNGNMQKVHIMHLDPSDQYLFHAKFKLNTDSCLFQMFAFSVDRNLRAEAQMKRSVHPDPPKGPMALLNSPLLMTRPTKTYTSM